jgi:hypothetical protein
VRYTELKPISKEEVQKALAGHNSSSAAKALLRMGLHETDWQWAERICLEALRNQDSEVNGAALTSIGHLARRCHHLTWNLLLPEVKRFLKDPHLGGRAEDVLDDIAVFAQKPDGTAKNQ